jgi:hypothetical protein
MREKMLNQKSRLKGAIGNRTPIGRMVSHWIIFDFQSILTEFWDFKIWIESWHIDGVKISYKFEISNDS